jgi:hypothetical protein
MIQSFSGALAGVFSSTFARVSGWDQLYYLWELLVMLWKLFLGLLRMLGGG